MASKKEVNHKMITIYTKSGNSIEIRETQKHLWVSKGFFEEKLKKEKTKEGEQK